MSWTIEEHIGESRPWPAQVVVYRGETSESLAYLSSGVADRLKAENAKLRELVRTLYMCTEILCDQCEYEHGVTCAFDAEAELRKLRIEVYA